TGEYERLPGQFLTLHLAFFRCRMNACFLEFLDEIPVGGLGEKLRDARSHLRSYLRHFLQPLFFRRSQVFERGKMLTKALPGALADKTDPERINQPGERILLAPLNLFEKILRGLF